MWRMLQCPAAPLPNRRCQSGCKMGEIHLKEVSRRGKGGDMGRNARKGVGLRVAKGHLQGRVMAKAPLGSSGASQTRQRAGGQLRIACCRKTQAHGRADKRREMSHRARLAAARSRSHAQRARQSPTMGSSCPRACT